MSEDSSQPYSAYLQTSRVSEGRPRWQRTAACSTGARPACRYVREHLLQCSSCWLQGAHLQTLQSEMAKDQVKEVPVP